MPHKGIVCPKCGARSAPRLHGERHDRFDSFGFDWITDVVAVREVLGFDENGKLHVDGGYSDTDDKNDRLACQKCGHQFPLIPEIEENVEWE